MKKSPAFEIKRSSHLIRRYIDEKLSKIKAETPEDFTENHSRIILFLLANQTKSIFQKDVENFLSITPATCSKTLKLLEKNGYIKRMSVSHDARLKRIHLTDKAISLSGSLKNEIAKLDSLLLEGIDKDELETFFSVLKKINNNISKSKKEEE